MRIPADGEALMKIRKLQLSKTDNTKSVGKKEETTSDVQISSEALELKTIQEYTRQIPDVRTDKVDQIKQKIENGDYAIDVDKLADILSKFLI